MNETLLANAILLQVGFIAEEKYNEYIDDLFLQCPDNDLLLELEWSGFEYNHTIQYLLRSTVDYRLFGHVLFLSSLFIY